MVENLQEFRPADRLRINVNDEWELKWWSKGIGVTPEELRAAVKMFGAESTDIRAVFGKRTNR